MKKFIAFLMLLILTFPLTQIVFAESEMAADQKTSIIITVDEAVSIDDSCTLNVYVKNIRNLEYAEILMHYNSDVLEPSNSRSSIEFPIDRSHTCSISYIAPGEIRLTIQKDNNEDFPEDEPAAQAHLYARKQGETGFSAEIEKAICTDGTDLALDTSRMPAKTQIFKDKAANMYVSYDRVNFEGSGNAGAYFRICELQLITTGASAFDQYTLMVDYDPAVIRFSKNAALQPGYSIDAAEEGKLFLNYKKSDNPEFLFCQDALKLPCILLGGSTDVTIRAINCVSLTSGTSLKLNPDSIHIESEPFAISSTITDTVLTVSGTDSVIGHLTEDFGIESGVSCEVPEDITEVRIENGITGIGAGIFTEFSNLNDILIPASVQFIENNAFSADVTIHSEGMSAAENYACMHGNPFVLPKDVLRGDMNKDGEYDAKDALQVLRMVAKLDPMYKYTADITGDGKADASDALLILKHAAKLIP